MPSQKTPHRHKTKLNTQKVAPAITWRAPEFLYRRKTIGWYSAIGLFFFGALVALLIGKVWIGVVVVALIFWLFLRYAEEQPKTIDYRIDGEGVTVGKKLITYNEIHSFSIDFARKTPLIILDTTYPLAMPVTILVKKSDFEAIVDLLDDHVPLKEGFSLIRWITHLIHY